MIEYGQIDSLQDKIDVLNNSIYSSNKISTIYNPFGVNNFIKKDTFSELTVKIHSCVTEGYRLFKTHNFLKIERI